nr:putative ribonuclease h protein [Quercus suber]
MVCAKTASPLNQSNQATFEEVLQDIDRDLLRFDGVALPTKNSNIAITASETSDNLRPEIQMGPGSKSPLSQPMKPTPLNDLTNMDLEARQSQAHAEGKWLRVTRSAHSFIDQPLNVSLGKRSPVNSENISTNTKHRAILAWNSSSGPATMPLIARKIKKCGVMLTDWSQHSFGCIRKSIESIGKMLSKAEEDVAMGLKDYDEVYKLKSELNGLLDKESLMWQQRARTLFLKCGDRNTSYFHSKASHRFRRNKILGLRNSTNAWCTDEKQVMDIATAYFRSLFATSQPSELSVVLEAVKPSVTQEMNAQLLMPFLKEEWRVGNGAAIGIYRDAWLPPPQSSKVISPLNSLDIDARVSVLIDHDRKCWNEGVIDNTFLPSDASRIKAIPLSLTNCDDCVFWPRNPNGIFSVKSGYKLLMESELDDFLTTSDQSMSKKVWKGIWSLRIPNRVKSLMWRAGLDSLPTRANLRKRRLINEDTCPHCNLNSESSLHALWSCPSLLPIWKVHFEWLIKDSWNCRSLLDVFQLCLESSDLLDLFAMISSLIWARRNQLRVGESAAPLDRICSMAVANLQEFRRASPPPLRSTPSVSPAKWTPPPLGWMKINFDGATFAEKAVYDSKMKHAKLDCILSGAGFI